MKNQERYLWINCKTYMVFIDLKKVNNVFDLIYQIFNELGTDTLWGTNKERYYEKIENIKFTKERLTN